MTPSWPCEVNGSSATSHKTPRSGSAFFKAATARQTRLSGLTASRPSGSFSAGSTAGNTATVGMPSPAASPAASTRAAIERRQAPGIDGIGSRACPRHARRPARSNRRVSARFRRRACATTGRGGCGAAWWSGRAPAAGDRIGSRGHPEGQAADAADGAKIRPPARRCNARRCPSPPRDPRIKSGEGSRASVGIEALDSRLPRE